MYYYVLDYDDMKQEVTLIPMDSYWDMWWSTVLVDQGINVCVGDTSRIGKLVYQHQIIPLYLMHI